MEKIFYPLTRRRVRTDVHIRELTARVRLSHKGFIQPLFVEEGLKSPRLVEGLFGVKVETIDSLPELIERTIRQGISKFLLFPVPAHKTESAFDFSFAAKIIREAKKRFEDQLWIAADLCLCSYTTHGHCGVLSEDHQRLINHKTVDVLTRYAAQLADAGADCIAPSDMMDGRIAAIRSTLDALGYDAVSIMSYAAKFSSQFYGPFRDACHSAPNTNGLQNRKTYQVSPQNGEDAVESALRDEREGADILMVKPAALYTDIISEIRSRSSRPLAAYHVSGEYAAIESLAAAGLLQRPAAHLEVWTALTRAGADIIISYAAGMAKEWIDQMEY